MSSLEVPQHIAVVGTSLISGDKSTVQDFNLPIFHQFFYLKAGLFIRIIVKALEKGDITDRVGIVTI